MTPDEKHAAVTSAVARGIEPAQQPSPATPPAIPPAAGTPPSAPASPAAPVSQPSDTPDTSGQSGASALPRHPPGPAVWANKDHDQPVTIVDEPPQVDPATGQLFQRVEDGNGGSGFVPFDELQPQGAPAAPVSPQAQSETPVTSVMPPAADAAIAANPPDMGNPVSAPPATSSDGDQSAPTKIDENVDTKVNTAPPADDLEALLNSAIEQEFGANQQQTPENSPSPATVDPAAINRQLSDYIASKRPLTAEAFAKHAKIDLNDAGRALQRAHMAGTITLGKNGAYRRPPVRLGPMDALDFLASKGGVSDPTGELRGMDLHKYMGPYGPVVRKTGMHPDKALQALVEAGYMRDPGRDNGGQLQLSVADFYDAMSRAASGEKLYVQEDQQKANDIRDTKRNEDIKPADWEDLHPIERRWGPEVWQTVQDALTAMDTHEFAWSASEINDAARHIADGMSPGDAFQQAFDVHSRQLLDPENDFAPEITAAFQKSAANAKVLFEDPPFPDVETPTNAQQQGSFAPGESGRPAGQNSADAGGQADVSGPAAEAGRPGEAGAAGGEQGPPAGERQPQRPDEVSAEEARKQRVAEWEDYQANHQPRIETETLPDPRRPQAIAWAQIHTLEVEPGKFTASYTANFPSSGGGGLPSLNGPYYANKAEAQFAMAQKLIERANKEGSKQGDAVAAWAKKFTETEPMPPAKGKPYGEAPDKTPNVTPISYDAIPNPVNNKPVPTDVAPDERLILMACGSEKTPTPNGETLSPIKLYTGAMYQVLKKWMPGLDKAKIRILSAKHGIMTDEFPKITGYDERMTPKKAQHLVEAGIYGQWDDFGRAKKQFQKGSTPYLTLKEGKPYKDVFIAGGAEYRKVFHAYVTQMIEAGVIAPDASINEVTGGIGEQRGQLGEYLRKIAAEQPAEAAAPAEPATSEQGADAKPQLVVPGAEQLTPEQAQKAAAAERAQKELEIRQKQSKLRKAGQQSVDEQAGGLFNTEPTQASIFDQPAPKPETSIDDALNAAMEQEFGTKPEPKTAGQAAADAVKNTAMGIDQVAKGLQALFGDKNKLNSGFTFDENTYAQAKPFFKAGAAHLKEAASNMQELALALVRALRNAGMTVDAVKAMTPYLKRFMEDIRDGKESLDAPGSSGILEPDRGNADAGNAVGETDVSASAGSDGSGADAGGNPADQGNGRRDSGSGVSQIDAPVVGEDGYLELPAREPGAESSNAAVGEPVGGAQSGESRLPDDRLPLEEAAGTVAKEAHVGFATKLAQQQAAEKIPAKPRDLQNIRDTLPVLTKEQQEDVLKVEERHAAAEGHGALITNGTGTGKTFSGLGAVKRFVKQGKKNILIVAPSQGILLDWQAAAKHFGIDLHILEDSSTDNGKGVTATTYSNLGDNPTLADRAWDLVVTDESHKLSSDKDGTPTKHLEAMRAITLHPSGMYRRGQMVFRKEWQKYESLKPTEKRPNPTQVAAADAAYAAWRAKYDAAKPEWEKAPRSKVLMLSATPFAYHFSLDYAEGYLFSYPKVPQSGAYNAPDGRDQFYIENFGYQKKNGKLNKPDAKVNSDVMERQFHEKMKKTGALFGRALEVEKDYDRKFLIAESLIGKKIDEAMTFLSRAENGRFAPLYDQVNKRFDYLAKMRLLEAIKAEAAIPYIKKSIALGRKVVVFHDYNEGGGISPFLFKFSPEEEFSYSVDGKHVTVKAQALYNEFLSKNPYVEKLDFAHYGSPINAITREFPNALIYNGTVPNKKRAEAKRLFNTDNNGANIIIVQSAAGEAGISLHDTTGVHQRVLINLGLPVRPTTALQEEGRIYRVGQKTDAIFRYLNTGTHFEMWTFADKTALRSSTAENLAMGDQGRAIKQAFIDAFNNADESDPHPDDGKGGKLADRPSTTAMSEFERAKTHYFANQKLRGRRDQRQGLDYFPTPEPLGLKMVEWANVKPGEKILEPSAGHGAIARYFPEDTARTLVEPSEDLAARAALTSTGARVEVKPFEALDIVNKFDAIVMNPPFGVGGKTAVEHIEKAAKHLKNGGRIVALVPRGGMMEKRLDKWYENAEGIYLVGRVDLPTVTFERAGTSVAAQIIILDKHTDKDVRPPEQSNRDYASAATINELFDRIENTTFHDRVEPKTKDVEVPAEGDVTVAGLTFNLKNHSNTFYADLKTYDRSRFRSLMQAAEANGGGWIRTIKSFIFKTAAERQAFLERVANPPQVEATTPAASAAGAGSQKFKTAEVTHAKTGKRLFVATAQDRVSAEEYQAMNAVAKKHGGYYSSFRGNGAVPGFQFPSEDARIQFLSEMQGPSQEPLESAPRSVATLSGKELMNFTGPQDMPALRKAAQTWYDANLRGSTVKMKDGTPVNFNQRGRNKTVSGGKGDLILRAVPAIRAIIEQGDVVLREPGDRPHVAERIVISAPVVLMGQVRNFAVSVHRTPDGHYQYDFTSDRSSGGPGIGARLASAGERSDSSEGAASEVNLIELRGNFKAPINEAPLGKPDLRAPNPLDKAITQQHVQALVNAVGEAGKRILGRQGIGINIFMRMAPGENPHFNPDTEIIHLALQAHTDARLTIRHEAMHALRQVGVFSPTEWAILARQAKKDWIYKYSIRERYQARYRARMDLTPDQLEEMMVEEAIADAFSEHWMTEPSSNVFGRIFEKVKQFLIATGNAMRGLGFDTADSIFRRTESGEVGQRQRGSGQDRGFKVLARQQSEPQANLESTPADDGGHFGGAASEEKAVKDFAASINLSYIDSSDAVKQGLRDAAAKAGDFTAARRGVVSHDQTRMLAEQLGLSVDTLLNRKTGEAWNAHELFAARAMVTKSQELVIQAAKRLAKTGSDVDRAYFMRVQARHAAIQEQVSGLASEAGRALNQFKMMVGPDYLRSVMDALSEKQKNGKIGRDAIDEMAKMIDTMKTPAQVNTMTRNMYKPGFFDMIREYYINSLLSGPSTHVVNFMSNLLTAANQIPETFLAEQIGRLHSGEKVQPGEAMARAVGLLEGSREGMQLAMGTLWTGEQHTPDTQFDQQTMKAIPDMFGLPIGEVVRIPSRFLMASDDLFKAVNYRAEINAQAIRLAKSEGLSGQQLAQRVLELRNDPTEDMIAAAHDAAKYHTFQTKLGPTGQSIMRFREALHLWWLLPFLRTPINIMKYAYERSPFSLLPYVGMKESRDAMTGKKGAAARDVQIARIAMGTMVLTGMAAMVLSGMATGGGGDDQKKKGVKRADGWQPYSLHIGNTFYSYLRFDPFALHMGVMADLVEMKDLWKTKDYQKIAWQTLGSVINNLVSKTWLKSATQFTAMTTDPQQSVEQYASTLAGGLIPNAVAQVARTMDPNFRDARTLLDNLKNRIPGLRETLPKRFDIFGNAIASEGNLGPDLFSPVYVSTQKNNPVAKALIAADYYPGQPRRHINGHDLTGQQYAEYTEAAGKEAMTRLNRLVTADTWARRTVDNQQKVLEQGFNKAREIARKRIMHTYPELAKKAPDANP